MKEVRRAFSSLRVFCALFFFLFSYSAHHSPVQREPLFNNKKKMYATSRNKAPSFRLDQLSREKAYLLDLLQKFAASDKVNFLYVVDSHYETFRSMAHLNVRVMVTRKPTREENNVRRNKRLTAETPPTRRNILTAQEGEDSGSSSHHPREDPACHPAAPRPADDQMVSRLFVSDGRWPHTNATPSYYGTLSSNAALQQNDPFRSTALSTHEAHIQKPPPTTPATKYDHPAKKEAPSSKHEHPPVVALPREAKYDPPVTLPEESSKKLKQEKNAEVQTVTAAKSPHHPVAATLDEYLNEQEELRHGGAMGLLRDDSDNDDQSRAAHRRHWDALQLLEDAKKLSKKSLELAAGSSHNGRSGEGLTVHGLPFPTTTALTSAPLMPPVFSSAPFRGTFVSPISGGLEAV